MNALSRQPISVRPSLVHGYGVFADADIAPGQLIEECHVLKCEKQGLLNDYVFGVYDERYVDHHVIPLGYGAIYNHSPEPNAYHKLDIENFRLNIHAVKPIKRGDEIYIYYGDNWLHERNIPLKQATLRYKVKSFLRRTSRLRRVLLLTTAIVLFVLLLRDMSY